MKIYDLFQYSGEDDLLEIRLNTLSEIIDKFYIVESRLTHTRKEKPLYFLESGYRFNSFKDRIVYIDSDYCKYSNAFYNDWAARMVLFNSLPDEDCIIHHSDLDEISNLDSFKNVLEDFNRPVSFVTNYFFFCLDLWARRSNDAIIMKKSWVRDDFYRYRDARSKNFFKIIDTFSWHYSSVGTPENIAKKWRAFAHSSEVQDVYKDPEYIKGQIKRKAGSWDIHAKDDELKLIEHIYPNLPKYLIENKDKFKHLFYEYYSK